MNLYSAPVQAGKGTRGKSIHLCYACTEQVNRDSIKGMDLECKVWTQSNTEVQIRLGRGRECCCMYKVYMHLLLYSPQMLN